MKKEEGDGVAADGRAPENHGETLYTLEKNRINVNK